MPPRAGSNTLSRATVGAVRQSADANTVGRVALTELGVGAQPDRGWMWRDRPDSESDCAANGPAERSAHAPGDPGPGHDLRGHRGAGHPDPRPRAPGTGRTKGSR